MARFHINYRGKSKVIRRLCELAEEMLGLGTSHDEAFYGDLGEEAYEHSLLREGNPHRVTLDDLGIEDLPGKVEALLEAVSSGYENWIFHSEEQVADHNGDEFVFRSFSNLLAWH